MKISEFINIVDSGQEPEMHYNNKTYWATWNNPDEKGSRKCFYEVNCHDEINFDKAEEILDKEYHGFKIRDMIESLGEDDIDY